MRAMDAAERWLAQNKRLVPPALVCGAGSAVSWAFVPMLLVWVGLLVGSPSYFQFRYMLVYAYALPAAAFMTLAARRGSAKRARGEPPVPAKD